MGWQSNTGATLGGMLGGPLGSLAGQYIGSHFENNGKHSNTSTFSNQQKGFNYGDLASDALGAYASYRGERDSREAMANAGKLNLAHTRKEATENGFNPLTVLRATGGQGSTHSADHGKLASAAFWSTFANQNSSQSRANLANTRASTLSMNNSLIDEYSGYTSTIPVRVGKITQQLDIGVAKRMRILPNGYLTGQEMEDILGEFHGGINMAIGTNIAAEVLTGGVNQYGKSPILQSKLPLPSYMNPPLTVTWAEIEKAIKRTTTKIFPTDWDNRNYRKEPFP
jgi:hypothetical protein